MKEHSETLELLYTASLESSLDSLFYQNIHRYIDYIKKTPEFSEVMDKSEFEYHKNHSDTWRQKTYDEKELDRRSEETFRIERFSLYASNYVTLEVRIYWPIEYYKNPPDDLKDRYDPVAFLMLRGFENTRATGFWTEKNLKMYNKWFSPEQKKLYEKDLKQFHIDFLLELKKKKDVIQKPSDNRIGIGMDGHKGIYRKDKEKLSYPISKNTKRFKLISHLFSQDKCSLSNLEKETNQTKDVVMKSIAEINKLFRYKLQVVEDLILSIPTGGYSLNKQAFDIEIND